MSIRDIGNTVNRSAVVSLNQRHQTIQNTVGAIDTADVIEVRLNGRSRLNAQLSYGGVRPLVTLFHDRNRDGRLGANEQVAIARSVSSATDELKAKRLDTSSPYYIQVVSTDAGESTYALTLDAPGATTSAQAIRAQGRVAAPGHWNASFLNRTRRNLTDYRRYDFSQPDAVDDLGRQGKRRKTVAELTIDYGLGSPPAIQRDNFVMEAWTRVRLRAGKFYRLSSNSDDGMRFIFRDTKTGETLTELNDNWIDRSVRSGEWSQVLTPAKTGRYDFYVQYYEKSEAAVVDVQLEKINPTGRVLAAALNVRSTPSTLNNAPIDVLSAGETFKIRRQVTSSTDTVYHDWYRIVSGKTRGFVAAGTNFVDIVGEATSAVVLGERGTNPPALPDDTSKPPVPGAGTVGVISSSVWITTDDRIAIRSDKSISGVELGRVGEGTSLSVVEKVTGGRYLNGFDSWYRVRLNLNGRDQEGFVAAYYVDVLNDGGRYSTGISKDNGLYKPHLNEVLNPTYYQTSYRPYIEQAASRYSWLDASVVAGIGSRESAWGRVLSPPGPGGTGDGGHGRGLMQIDDRFHQGFIGSGRWSRPKDNIDYAIDEVLSQSYVYLNVNTSLNGTDLLRGAIAAYNAGLSSVMTALQQGRDVDYYTTGQDYSWDVLNRAGWFQLHGWT